MKQLIINADDFGWDAETVDATIALFDRGLLTSATIMTGFEATKRAIEFARTAPDTWSFGLHFNIVDGHLPCSKTPNSLCTKQGMFRWSHLQRLAALFGQLRASDIAAELRAQLAILKQMGVRISHLDSHGHLHKFPTIARAIKPVLEEFGVARVRRPQNLYMTRSFLDVLDRYCETRFPPFVTTDYLFMAEGEDHSWLEGFVSALPEGVTELGIHPGRAESWRNTQTEPLLNYDIAQLQKQGIDLVSYRELGGKRPVTLSITHNVLSYSGSEENVVEASEASPQDGVPRRRIVIGS